MLVHGTSTRLAGGDVEHKEFRFDCYNDVGVKFSSVITMLVVYNDGFKFLPVLPLDGSEPVHFACCYRCGQSPSSLTLQPSTEQGRGTTWAF